MEAFLPPPNNTYKRPRYPATAITCLTRLAPSATAPTAAVVEAAAAATAAATAALAAGHMDGMPSGYRNPFEGQGMMSSYEIGSIHHGTHSSQQSDWGSTASSVTYYEQPAPAPAPAPVPERSSLTYMDATRKERNAGFTKHGNNDDGTHGAHKLSHELATAILPHVKGRPGLVDAVARDLNRDQNIRIKTAKGNLETDRDNDKELIDLIKSGKTAIDSVEATKRAVQAFKGSADANTGTIQQVHDFIGNLEFAGMQISELASGAGGSFFTKG